jgi:hypothetical protein
MVDESGERIDPECTMCRDENLIGSEITSGSSNSCVCEASKEVLESNQDDDSVESQQDPPDDSSMSDSNSELTRIEDCAAAGVAISSPAGTTPASPFEGFQIDPTVNEKVMQFASVHKKVMESIETPRSARQTRSRGSVEDLPNVQDKVLEHVHRGRRRRCSS